MNKLERRYFIKTLFSGSPLLLLSFNEISKNKYFKSNPDKITELYDYLLNKLESIKYSAVCSLSSDNILPFNQFRIERSWKKGGMTKSIRFLPTERTPNGVSAKLTHVYNDQVINSTIESLDGSFQNSHYSQIAHPRAQLIFGLPPQEIFPCFISDYITLKDDRIVDGENCLVFQLGNIQYIYSLDTNSIKETTVFNKSRIISKIEYSHLLNVNGFSIPMNSYDLRYDDIGNLVMGKHIQVDHISINSLSEHDIIDGNNNIPNDDFVVGNNFVNSNKIGNTLSCRVADLPTCTIPAVDVQCAGEVYRGCFRWEPDIAQDDFCCAGWGPGLNDNIDHAGCRTIDAPTGCLWFEGCEGLDTSFPCYYNPLG
jgi:hypothetical protein